MSTAASCRDASPLVDVDVDVDGIEVLLQVAGEADIAACIGGSCF
jgi:hypothetical protein